MTPTHAELTKLAAEYARKSPQDVLELACRAFGRVALAFSGAEDVVLVDMASRLGVKPEVFFLDTGRLHPETYRFLDKVRERYRITLEAVFPSAPAVEALVKAKGLFSFYKDGHQECCAIRKVEPLRRRLDAADAWITGQRRDQSRATRAALSAVEADDDSVPGRTLAKLNPLAAWTSGDVWYYIHENDVPHNELHSRGFVSIGCEPCTRATLPNQDEREGRWWWENAAGKECGLHLANIRKEQGE